MYWSPEYARAGRGGGIRHVRSAAATGVGDRILTPPRDRSTLGAAEEKRQVVRGSSRSSPMRMIHLLCVVRGRGLVNRSAGFSVPGMW